MKKKVTRLVAAAVVLVVLLVVGVFVWIDHLAKAGVEAGATYALGVETKADTVDVQVLAGQVEIAELNVDNPAGFDADHFVHLGRGRVAVSLGSLRQDKVVVPELTLSGVSVNLERKGSQANYTVILDELKKLQSGREADSAEPRQGKKFVVRHLAIDDVTVQMDLLPIGGELTRVPIKIQRLELRDVGSDTDEGVLLAQLTGIVMQAILDSVLKEGGGLIPPEIAADLASGLKDLEGLSTVAVQVVGDVTTMVNGEVKRVTDIATQFGDELGKPIEEGIEKAAKELEKGLGNLLAPAKTKDSPQR